MPPKKKIKANSLEIPTSALECPVCLDVIKDPPIFTCENTSGHSVCSKCHKDLIKDKKPCPVCRQPLASRRNIALENIVEGFPNKIQCKFDGCGFKRSSREAVKEHEDECEYRYVPCERCDAKICLRSIAEHVTKIHRGDMSFLVPGFSKFKYIGFPRAIKKDQIVLRVEGSEPNPAFLLNISSENNSPTIAVWVSCVTPKKSLAKSYTYTLQVRNMKDKMAEKDVFLLQGTRRCVPCDLSHHEVLRMRMCIVLDKETITDAVAHDDEKSRVEVGITISKL